MATIKKEEYPIKDNGFEYNGKVYNCSYAIKRDIKMIIQEAETSHKDSFNELYDRNTLRADKIVYVVTRSEEHSDYVEAVFRKRENAEKYCKQFNDDENEYSRDITEIIIKDL